MDNKICFYAPPYPYVQSYYDLIDCSVQHGLSALEGFCRYELEHPHIQAAKEIKKYADEKGVYFPCFSVFINLVGEDAEEMMHRLKGFADVCAVLQCPLLHHTIVSNYCDPDSVLCHREDYYEKGVAAAREIYDYAAAIGVKTICEPQGYIFNGKETFGRFLQDVNRDIGIVADFGNVYQVGETIQPFLETFGHRAQHVHIKNVLVKETNDTGEGLKTLDGKYMFEVGLAEGVVDIQKCISILKSKGYDGCYALEFSAPCDQSPYMKESIETIRQWYSENA